MAFAFSDRQKEVFGLALDSSPESREPLVRQACGDDRSLYETVMEMLRKHDGLGDFLESPARLSDPPTAPMQAGPNGPGFGGNARFQLRERIGAGGFGAVFEAYDRQKDMVVALKALHNPEAAALRMFKREFRTLAGIAHPNLVQLHELFDDGRHWFFTMELVRGADFVSYVRGEPDGRHHRLRSALRQLAEAVSYIHERKTLHRDIKPHNIRVTAAGQLKLLDFGLVRDVSSESGRENTAFAGTAAYMAPELATERSLTEAGDWYSVGAVLYEALTGRPPFEGRLLEVLLRKREGPPPAPRDLAADIPADLEALCLALLERDPNARPTGAAILERLNSSGTGLPVHPNSSSPTLLVGRESHLAALHAALNQVRAGEAVCVHVQGRSGMGKTALVRRFLSEAQQQGALVLSGRCYESESVPFKALDPVVDALGDHLKRLRGHGVEAFLPRERPLQALARVFPTLLQVEAIGRVRDLPGGEISSRDLQNRAMAALKEILARLAEKAPCVVHIDDLQWGDLDSVHCLANILAPPDPPGVLFLFGYRSEEIASSGHLAELLALARDPDGRPGAARELAVGPLTPHESQQLARDLLGPAAGSAADSICREAEGMPLFIHELAMHARAGLRSDGEAPVSLQEMIQRRIRLLPPPARRMMEVVGLAAQPIEVEVARRAARLADGEQAARNALAAQNLIRFKSTAGGGEVEPFHDKVREAAVAGIEPAARRGYFEALAVALESRERADPEVVYQYFLAAGNLAKAEAWIESAAERAERALAFDLAVRLREKHLEIRAADGEARAQLLERLADALASAGRGLKSARAYQSAAQYAPAGKHAELLRKAGEQYIRSGHFEEGQALLTGLLEKAGFRVPAHRWQALAWLVARRAYLRVRGLGFDPRGPAELKPGEAERLDICRVASLAMTLQDPIRSAELQSRHLLHSLRLGEPYRIANSLAMEAGYLAARGGAASYAAANKLLDKVEDLATRSNHPNGRTLALSVRTKVAWLTGNFAEAARLGEEVNRLATEQFTRVAWEAYPSSMFWICALACLGRWREAVERLPGLQAGSEARGDLLEMASLPVFTFAYVRWLLSDQPERAAAELENARSRLEDPGFVPQRFGVYSGLTDLALYQGLPDQARAAAAEGWAQLESAMALRLQPVRIMMLHSRARVACASAATAEAMDIARRIRREKTHWGAAIASLIEATVAAEARRTADAVRLLEEAERGLAEAGIEHYVAAARYRRAHLLPDGEARREAGRLAAVWFAAQRVARPERLMAVLAPGSWLPPDFLGPSGGRASPTG